jgi:hypothetical protein
LAAEAEEVVQAVLGAVVIGILEQHLEDLEQPVKVITVELLVELVSLPLAVAAVQALLVIKVMLEITEVM